MPHESVKDGRTDESARPSALPVAEGRRRKDAILTDRKRRPVALGVVPENVPAELKALEQWVTWRFEWKRGKKKWDKPPVRAFQNCLASSTDPATWAPFEDALASYRMADEGDRRDGIGLALLPGGDGDVLVGTDLDDCRDPDTGAIDAWALSTVRDFDSYAEVSPTGTGLRIFSFGRLDRSHKNKAVEVYKGGRYLTITGQVVPGAPLEVRPSQGAIDRLVAAHFPEKKAPDRPSAAATNNGDRNGAAAGSPSDDEVLRRCCACPTHGNRFRELYYRGASAGDDASGCDIFAAGRLWYWSQGDRDQVERLFRASKLMRSKWDERHHADGRSYGEGTLDQLKGNDTFHPDPMAGVKLVFPTKPPGGRATGGETPLKPGDFGVSSVSSVLSVSSRGDLGLPLDCLPGPLAEYAREASTAMGCDPAHVAVPALVVAAGIIGNRYALRLKRAWVEHPTLWGMVVSESGTTKSPAFAAATKPAFDLQAELSRRHRQRLAEWHKAGGADGGEERPVEAQFITADTTIEAVAELLHHQPRGLLLARDELGAWLSSFRRYKSGGDATDAHHWLELYSAKTLVVNRRTGEQRKIIVPDACASVVGTIQPAVLAKAITPQLLASGLLARFLLVWPHRRRKRWTEDDVSEATQAGYTGLIKALHELPHREHEGRFVPDRLELSSAARRLWVEFYDRHAELQADAGGSLAAMLSKVESAPLRFSLVHHVVTRAAAGRPVGPLVPSESMAAGIALAEWFAGENRRVYELLSESAEGNARRDLVEMIRRRGGAVTARELVRSGRCPTSAKAEAELDGLAADKLGAWEDVPPGAGGGRPTRRFRLFDDTDKTDETDETP